MKFKAILRRIGNSKGVLIPLEVITGFKLGEEIELEVITGQKELDNVITQKQGEVITQKERVRFNTQWCKDHGGMKGTCGCQ